MSAELDLRRQPGPHVFVDDLDNIDLADDDRFHLVKSLRLRPGDPLTVSDGCGRWRSAVFGEAVTPVGDIVTPVPFAHPLTLAIALTKSAKPELVVQKATELGIDHIVVFGADRSVARWDDTRQRKGLQRLSRVAREAAMQSRQVRIPTVSYRDGLRALCGTADGNRGEGQGPVVRADFGGAALDASHRVVAIGPEGGWTPSEIETVRTTIDLGESVLRAETAALVAAMQMVLARSRLGHLN